MRATAADFDQFARMLAGAAHLAARGYSAPAIVELLVADVADVFHRSNSRFNVQRFLAACKPQELAKCE